MDDRLLRACGYVRVIQHRATYLYHGSYTLTIAT